MQGTVNGLLHDAAALYRFVDFICQFCDEQQSTQTYAFASEEFFRYVRELGSATQRFLGNAVRGAKARRAWFAKDRQKIAALRECWSELHTFVKSSADGHRLRTPGPLLDLGEHLLRTLAGLSRAKIVILISPELNYFQHSHTQLKDLAAELSLNIEDAPPFPEQLGFIPIPYSQGGSVFTNTLIFHELGPFVFEELSEWSKLNGPAEQALKTWRQFSALTPANQQWCRDRVRYWAEETFCDLFALGLVGPTYAFASIELFSLLGFLDEESSKDFQSSHPAHGFRFREQLIQLRSHGWWREIARLDTDHVKLIRERSAIPETSYRFREGPGDLIGCFLRMRIPIRKLVQAVIGNQGETLRTFRKHNLAIQECLRNGVVPSALGETEDKGIRVATINASACVYLATLSKLIQKVRGRSSDNLAHRSEMAARLEM